MFDPKSRMYIKCIKMLQKVQTACNWAYLAGFFIIVLGFITSIAFFTRNTAPNLTITLLMSGLGVLCISSIVDELSRLCQIWMRNKLRKHMQCQTDACKPLNMFNIASRLKETFSQNKSPKRISRLQNKTVS